jgi:hypothetical protein
MDQTSSHDYFRIRAEEERAAAEQAEDERAAHSHRELAEHYERLSETPGAEPVKRTVADLAGHALGAEAEHHLVGALVR